MASTATAIGNNGGRTFHYRLPIGIRHVGHQYVTALHPRHLPGIQDEPHWPAAYFLADGTSRYQYFRFSFQAIALQRTLPDLGLDGFGPGLQDIQLTVH